MSQSLARTVFSTGADDALRTIDAYSLNDTSVLNAIGTQLDDEALDAFDSMLPPDVKGPLGLKLPNVPDLGLKLSGADMQTALGSMGEGLGAALSEMPVALQNTILSPQGPNAIMAIVDGVSSSISGFSEQAVRSMGSLLKNISGANVNFSVSNVAAIARLGANAVMQASRMGIPNAYQLMSQGITNQNVMRRMTSNLLSVAVSTSNVSLLVGISKGPVAQSVPSMMPKFIPEYTRNFKLSPNAKQKDYPSIAAELLGSFSRIDANWSVNRRAATARQSPAARARTTNTSQISRASQDFQKVMRSLSRSSNVLLPQAQPARVVSSMAMAAYSAPVYEDYDTDTCLAEDYGDVFI